MGSPHAVGAFVAQTETDVYGPGKVIDVVGEHRRVMFVYFVATIRVTDLRPATAEESAQVKAWIQQRQTQYGGRG